MKKAKKKIKKVGNKEMKKIKGGGKSSPEDKARRDKWAEILNN